MERCILSVPESPIKAMFSFFADKFWKHWKTPRNRAKNMIKLGVLVWSAWKIAYLHGYAKPACCTDVHKSITKERLARVGLV